MTTPTHIADVIQEHRYMLVSWLSKTGPTTSYLVRNEMNSTSYELHYTKILNYDDALHEVDIVSCLMHPNIIECFEYWVTGDELFVIVNHNTYGSLEDNLRRNGPFQELHLIKFIQQMASALQHLRVQKIANLNISPSAIQLGKNLHVYLSDFSCSIRIDGTGMCHYFAQSKIQYRAPEVLQGEGTYDPFAADIWALGCSIYQLATGSLPFDGQNTKELFQKICDTELTFPPSVGDTLRDIILAMLQPDPTQRIAPEQLVSMTYEKPPPSIISSTNGGLSGTIVKPKVTRLTARNPIASALGRCSLPPSYSADITTSKTSARSSPLKIHKKRKRFAESICPHGSFADLPPSFLEQN